MSGIVYTVGTLTSSVTTRALSTVDGSQLLTKNHGDLVYGVATDFQGNFITGGNEFYLTEPYASIRKYNAAGTQQWVAIPSQVFGVATDTQGAVCVACQRVDNLSMRKYNSSGTAQWSKDHGGATQCVATDADDNVYWGGASVFSITTRKYNSSGTQQWTANHGATVWGIAVDASNNVCTGGDRTSSITTRKYNSSGTQQWTADHGAAVYCVAVDADGNVYTGGAQSSSLTTRKYNSSGTLQWSVDHGAAVWGIAVDEDGNVYTVGDRVSSLTTRKYNSSGTLQWSVDHGANLRGVALYFSPTTDVPALPIPLGLGVPFQTVFDSSPGLALRLSLGAPTSVTVPPPDPALVPLQPIYLLYVTGGELLRLPLIGFQCARRYNESTWMVVECPTASGLRATVAARMAAGGRLAIFSGVRYADGAEQTGEFLQAALTEVAEELTANSGILRLRGRVIPAPFTRQTRTLRQVTARGLADNEKRTADAAVDPLLRPNDTVDDGVQTWTAGSIHIRIDPVGARMRVVEL